MVAKATNMNVFYGIVMTAKQKMKHNWEIEKKEKINGFQLLTIKIYDF